MKAREIEAIAAAAALLEEDADNDHGNNGDAEGYVNDRRAWAGIKRKRKLAKRLRKIAERVSA